MITTLHKHCSERVENDIDAGTLDRKKTAMIYSMKGYHRSFYNGGYLLCFGITKHNKSVFVTLILNLSSLQPICQF